MVPHTHWVGPTSIVVVRVWCIQLQEFLAMDVRTIMGIPLYTRNTRDFWSWNFERSGVFSVKSAYRMLVATRERREVWLEVTAGTSSSVAEEGPWKNLWNTKVPGEGENVSLKTI